MEVGNNPFPSEEVTGLAAFENLEPVSSLSVVPEEAEEASSSAPPAASDARQRQERLDRTLPLDLSAPPPLHRSEPPEAAREDDEEEELDPAPEDEVLQADGLSQLDASQPAPEVADEREPTADHLFDASAAAVPPGASEPHARQPDLGWDDDEATRVLSPLAAAAEAEQGTSTSLQMEWDDDEPPTTMRPNAMFEGSPIADRSGWEDPEDNRTEIYDDPLTPVQRAEPLPPAPQRKVASATQTLTGGAPSPFPVPLAQAAPAVAPIEASHSFEAPVSERFFEALKSGDRRSWIVLGGGATGLLLLALILRAAGGSHAVASAVFSTQPADARVLVDGKEVPGTGSPYSLADLAPGDHKLVVSKPGFKDYSGAFVLNQGESKTLPVIELAAEAREVGFAIRSTPEGAAVWVDGQPANQVTPARLRGIASGIHRLQLKLDGYTDYELQMFVPEGTLLQLPAAELVASPDAAAQAAKPTRAARTKRSDDDEEELTPRASARSRKSADDEEPAPRSYRSRRSESADDDSSSSSRASRGSYTSSYGATAPQSAPSSGSGKIGTLRLNTRPWAQVIVDGRMVGNTPQPNLQLSAGKHKLQLINQQLGLHKNVTVTIKAGEVTTQVLNLAE